MVPNQFPSIQPLHRIAIVGEAPGKDEAQQGKPFVGLSGSYLKGRLSKANINFDQCYVGNVAQFQPLGNDISRFSWDGPEIQSGLANLEAELQEYRPNVVILLGNTALKAAKDPATVHPLKPGKFANSILNWRGSVFMVDHPNSPFRGLKCIASIHPAAIQRQYKLAPLLQFDLHRAYRESFYPETRLPVRNIILTQEPYEVVNLLNEVNAAEKMIAVDIEGGIGTFCCISVATSPSNVFIVPISRKMGNLYSSEDEEAAVWEALARLLANPKVPKVLQNSLYDRFVLQYSYQMPIVGVVDDTMLKHWELYCELPKKLGVQASIYTDEPYYKDDRGADSYEVFLEYCCKDSAVTYEINEKLEKMLVPPWSPSHYRLNVSLEDLFLYMELKGIRYDREKADLRREEIRQEKLRTQGEFDSLTGIGVAGKSVEQLEATMRDLMCFKRDPSTPKNPYRESYHRAKELIHKPNRTLAENGELGSLLNLSINIESPAQLANYLYVKLRLPIQTNKENNPTTDEEALLKLRVISTRNKLDHPRSVIDNAIRIRRLGTREGMLRIYPDSDGRIRCGYNIVGTETGRISCYTSPTGSGYNLQTIPSDDRDLFLADPDHWFFQCDLSGADGWTVGAHCAALGDPTMLEDLRFGIKPAKVLCLGLRGNIKALNPRTPREELREWCKEVKKEDWDYFGCKVGIWGTCYLMGPDTLRGNLLVDSDGKLYWSLNESREFQRLVFIRYQVKRWHESMARRLSTSPSLVSASGHRRVFFGRSTEILGKALAHEPQANTTYATNMASHKLWNDQSNRNPDQSLKIQPLHQVHDALCGQFRKDYTDTAKPKIREYFNNPLLIANQYITIPFEGGYGPSWKETTEGII